MVVGETLSKAALMSSEITWHVSLQEIDPLWCIQCAAEIEATRLRSCVLL